MGYTLQCDIGDLLHELGEEMSINKITTFLLERKTIVDYFANLVFYFSGDNQFNNIQYIQIKRR